MNPRESRPTSQFFENHLQPYLDGELDASTERLVAAELRESADFRALKNELEDEQIELIGSLVVTPKLSSRFASKVTERIRAGDFPEESHEPDAASTVEETGTSSSRRSSGLRRFATGLAAGLAIAGLVVTLTTSPDPATSPGGPAPGADGSIVQSPTLPADPLPGGPTAPLAIVDEPSAGRGSSPDLPEPGDEFIARAPVDHAGPPLPVPLAGSLVADAISTVQLALGSEENPCTDDLNQDASTDTLDVATVVMSSLAAAPFPPGLEREIDCTRLFCDSSLEL